MCLIFDSIQNSALFLGLKVDIPTLVIITCKGRSCKRGIHKLFIGVHRCIGTNFLFGGSGIYMCVSG